MAEPTVSGLGFATEAAITAPAPRQWAANFTGGGVQQSTTVNVIFVTKVKGFCEFVTFTPPLINFMETYN